MEVASGGLGAPVSVSVAVFPSPSSFPLPSLLPFFSPLHSPLYSPQPFRQSLRQPPRQPDVPATTHAPSPHARTTHRRRAPPRGHTPESVAHDLVG